MSVSKFSRILPLVLALALSACQSTGGGTQENAAPPKNRCEQLKQQRDYNTATGRAVAKATCEGIFTKLSNKESTLWMHREHARQRACKARTGEFCPD